MDFSFATAANIRFGRGAAMEAVAGIAAMGRRVLLVTGANAARADWLADALRAAGCEVTGFATPHEPDMPLIRDGIARARDTGAAVVVSLGGGAAIDAGKAIAALVPTSRDMMDHLEVVGLGLPLEQDPLPFVAIPTTSGTGAEVTRNAVLAVPEARRKVSLRDARMLPRLAVVDPSLTDHCPRSVTLASGLDAVTQVIEPYISTRSNPLTDALCRSSIPRGLNALRVLMEREEPAARDDLAFVSLCGGIALANAGLGVVHGLAGPLGGLSGAAHGEICGVLLPHGLAANQRFGEGQTVARITEVQGWIAAALGCDAAQALEGLADWSISSGLRGLDAQGVSAEDRIAAAQAAASSSSMKANPVALSEDTLRDVLEAAR